MLLKLEVGSLLVISGLKEFQSVTVREKKLHFGFNCWGNEVVTITRSSVATRRFNDSLAG